MIRRICLFALAAVAVLPWNGTAQGLKLGYIHSEAIIAQDPDALAAQAQFRREMEPWESELKLLEDEIASLMQAFQAQQVTLTSDARRTRQRDIVTKQETYQGRLQQIEETAQQRQQELVQPIMETINSVIQAIRDEGDYTFIFDASSGGLIAADEAYDLTELVVARIAANRAAGR